MKKQSRSFGANAIRRVIVNNPYKAGLAALLALATASRNPGLRNRMRSLTRSVGQRLMPRRHGSQSSSEPIGSTTIESTGTS